MIGQDVTLPNKENGSPMSRPLVVYGRMVVNLFSHEVNPDDLICLLPIQNRDHISCMESYQEFFLHAQEKWSETLQAVAVLRDKVTEERLSIAEADPTQVNEVRTPLLDQLSVFESSLNSGDEGNIIDNPFFILTQMVFQLNMQAAHGTFKDIVKGTVSEFCGRGTSAVSSKFHIKPFLSVVFFILSSWATFHGVHEFFQTSAFQNILATLSVEISGETSRQVIGMVVGFFLSLVVLDFKSRLLQEIAEKEQFWGGLVHLFKMKPRWVFLAVVLTFVSIHANYHGLATRFVDQETSYFAERTNSIKKNTHAVVVHKNTTDLNRILVDQYGVVLAGFIILFAIFFSILFNFGEILFFSRSIIKTAREDGKAIKIKSSVFSKLSDEFVQNINDFFEKKEIWVSLLSWLPRPSKLLIQDAVFIWLGHLSFELKYGEVDTNFFVNSKIWFLHLFRPVIRKKILYGVLALDLAMDRIREAMDRDECGFLGILYPELQWNKNPDKISFIQLGNQLLLSMKKGQERFDRNLKRSCTVPLFKKLNFMEAITSRKLKSTIQRDFEMTLNLAYKELAPRDQFDLKNGNDNFVKSITNKTKKTGLCSYCNSAGILKIWECDTINPVGTCHTNTNNMNNHVLQKFKGHFMYFLIYYIYYPISKFVYLVFFSTFSHDKEILPWSRKIFIQNYCELSANKNSKDQSTVSDCMEDILNILTIIPLLKNDYLKDIMKKIEMFDSSWISPWKSAILHYTKILDEIIEEAKMVTGAGIDYNSHIQLYINNTSLYTPLYYKSPRIYSLSEQLIMIVNLIKNTSDFIDEAEFLHQQKKLYADEVNESCMCVDRLLLEIKMGLVGGDMDYQVWKSMGGDKVVKQIMNEIDNIRDDLQKYQQMDVIEHSKDVFIKLNWLKDRSKQLRDHLIELRNTIKMIHKIA
ncbi:MAG: hypothetical protein HQL65_05875 [Magnetococcales bacterium]|nr:hypothetical protein [Magnetococcales bacterium]